ncbi:MAG: hypothetical protein LH645_06105 [Actinomycetia bacterium]|nr:hypothetical protein [Actinomycetes bacterium]
MASPAVVGMGSCRQGGDEDDDTARTTLRSLSTVAVAASMAPAAIAVTAVTWHIVGADVVENARITEDVIKGVDSSNTTVEYRKGREGIIALCGFQLTEHISASRQARWTTPDRTGSTLILQFRAIVDGGNAFTRLKQAYVNCTADTFGGTAPANRVTVHGSYSKKKKQLKLGWAIYTSGAKTETLRAEGLAVKRAGGALIITRSITKDTTTLRADVNQQRTARQFAKYKAAAFS